jgi:hypothetical protein
MPETTKRIRIKIMKLDSEPTSALTPIASRRTRRRLKPEIARRLAEQRRNTAIQALYERPAQELTPEEIARLKSAFFSG